VKTKPLSDRSRTGTGTRVGAAKGRVRHRRQHVYADGLPAKQPRRHILRRRWPCRRVVLVGVVPKRPLQASREDPESVSARSSIATRISVSMLVVCSGVRRSHLRLLVTDVVHLMGLELLPDLGLGESRNLEQGKLLLNEFLFDFDISVNAVPCVFTGFLFLCPRVCWSHFFLKCILYKIIPVCLIQDSN